MKDFWDNRYSHDQYAYGIEANEWLKGELEKLTPGKILFPAEGEGRNAVFAASLGWNVKCFDYSISGKSKALNLAQKLNVEIDYAVCDYQDFNFNQNEFDAIGLIFFHLKSKSRKELHRLCSRALKNGGYIIFEAFSKLQINNNSGGPKDESMLYEIDDLLEDFINFQFAKIEQGEVMLNEGLYHQGKANTIRLLLKKNM